MLLRGRPKVAHFACFNAQAKAELRKAAAAPKRAREEAVAAPEKEEEEKAPIKPAEPLGAKEGMIKARTRTARRARARDRSLN